jgi:FlaA1/EpsC-like NDP-sugar epimerase
MTVVLFTLMTTFLTSTYMMTYSHRLYLFAEPVLNKLKLSDVKLKGSETTKDEAHQSILFLGFYKIANHLLHAMKNQNPSIKEKIAVIDFNPDVYRNLNRHGVKCVFGDLSNTATLKKCGLESAKVVVSSIPDTILKGISNLTLLTYTKKVNPKARVIVTAESIEEAKILWAAGADFVILPYLEAADKTATLMEMLLNEEAIPNICSESRRRIMAEEGGIGG